jgi:hypothetical protein
MTKHTSEDVLELDLWQEKVIKKLYDFEDDWLKANLLREGIPLDRSAEYRCKVVKCNARHHHLWDSTLYIDNKLVSILSINIITMEAEVSNTDGFISKGHIH